mgnify:CR=1 FL=1
MLLATLLFIIGLAYGKVYSTTQFGQEFTIYSDTRVGKIHVNLTLEGGKYFAILFNKQLDFNKDMLVFAGEGNGEVKDLFVGKASRANTDFEMTYNKTIVIDGQQDWTPLIQKNDDGSYTMGAERQFGTNDQEDYTFQCGGTTSFQWRIGTIPRPSGSNFEWVLEPEDKGTFVFATDKNCNVKENPSDGDKAAESIGATKLNAVVSFALMAVMTYGLY